MRPPRLLPDEEARLLALAEYGFEGAGDPSLDPIVALAARMFDVPMAVVNLIDREHVFLAAATGIATDLDPELARRDISFCAHAITHEEPLVVADATLDPRFHDNPLVTGDTQFRFYAGVPLISPGGHGLGAFCIIDTRARSGLSAPDLAQLQELAGLVLDKLELRRLETARRASQARFESIAQNSPDAVVCADAARKVTVWNRAAAQMFGMSEEEMLGQDVAAIVPEHIRTRLYEDLKRSAAGEPSEMVGKTTEFFAQRKDGTVFPTEFSLSVWMEDGAPSYGAIIRDISDRRRAEAELFRLAHHDALTSLPNRSVLVKRLSEATAAKRPASVIMVSLDDLGAVNDTLGKGVGDALVKLAAQRLTGSVRPFDTVARLSGHVFALMLHEVGDPLRAATAAEHAVNALMRPFSIDGHDVHVIASAGIAITPGHGEEVEETIANANLALAQAKAEGGGARRVFAPAMRQAAIARRQHDAEIRRAIDNRELVLHYQPQIRLQDGALVGAEALLRWQHPERGLLSPGAFLHAIEGGLLAATVGNWVLETACRQTARWRRQGASEDFRIGVNLFGAQFRADDLATDVEVVLAKSGLPPTALELEITETILIDDDDATIAPLVRLREQGVGVAFDDYGTGYASLSLLKRFPISRLKIDQSFVRTMCTSREDEAVIGAVLYLGKRFEIDVIAEGIETPHQAARLTRMGCTDGQGYLFGRPMTPETFAGRFFEAPLRSSQAG
ncbi:MAG: EAL domain-containing protein [Hyphomonadaceae bacterium]|nr:EAL domain-containing protein [Hyphomonadaceae bacterium]